MPNLPLPVDEARQALRTWIGASVLSREHLSVSVDIAHNCWTCWEKKRMKLGFLRIHGAMQCKCSMLNLPKKKKQTQLKFPVPIDFGLLHKSQRSGYLVSWECWVTTSFSFYLSFDERRCWDNLVLLCSLVLWLQVSARLRRVLGNFGRPFGQSASPTNVGVVNEDVFRTFWRSLGKFWSLQVLAGDALLVNFAPARMVWRHSISNPVTILGISPVVEGPGP